MLYRTNSIRGVCRSRVLMLHILSNIEKTVSLTGGLERVPQQAMQEVTIINMKVRASTTISPAPRPLTSE